MKTPEIVILGHTGFIGQAIFEQLVTKSAAIKGISSSDTDLRKPESIDYLNKIITENSILIFSAAVIRQRGNNPEILEDNIRIATNVAQALENHPIKKCVYLSTADVYGYPNHLPITEETPIDPQTYYATAKYCSESLLSLACKMVHVPLLTLRYSGIFGPGQKEPRYGPNSFIETALKDGVIKLWGDGKELRDMVYVKDLVKVIIQLSESNTKGIFNIATGKSITFMEAAEILCQILPNSREIVHQERTGPKFDQTFDISKLKQTLPHLSFIPLSQAFKEMLCSRLGY